MNQIKLWLVKYMFKSNRIAVYESLESSLSHVGTKKQELISVTFKRWADRDIARGKYIGSAYRAIQQRLERGMDLSEAMSPFIPVEEMLTIQAGEKGIVISGDKPKIALAIESARNQKIAADEMKAAVRGVLLEPISQTVIFLLSSMIYGAFVWPEMLAAYPEKYWPGWSLPMIQFQVWTAANWSFSFLVVVILAIYYWSLPNWTGKSRLLAEKLPFWSIYRDRMASAMLGVLGGLLHGGLTLEEALKRINKRSTPYLKWHINRIIRIIPSCGDNPMLALKTGLFSQSVLDRVEDAHSSREFDETLTHIGREALGSILKVVKRTVMFASLIIITIIAVAFLYQTAVQVFGVQDATDNFLDAQMYQNQVK